MKLWCGISIANKKYYLIVRFEDIILKLQALD